MGLTEELANIIVIQEKHDQIIKELMKAIDKIANVLEFLMKEKANEKKI